MPLLKGIRPRVSAGPFGASSGSWKPPTPGLTTRSRNARQLVASRPWQVPTQRSARLGGHRTMSLVAAGGVLALLGVVAAYLAVGLPENPSATKASTSVRIPVDAPAPGPQDAVLLDAPDPTGTLNLGDLTAGMDNLGLSVDTTSPDGLTVTPDIGVGIEPGPLVDGLVVPLVNTLTQGAGDLPIDTPDIGSLAPINVDVAADGAVGASVKAAPWIMIDRRATVLGEKDNTTQLLLHGTYACRPHRRPVPVVVRVDAYDSRQTQGRGNSAAFYCDGKKHSWSVNLIAYATLNPKGRGTTRLPAADIAQPNPRDQISIWDTASSARLRVLNVSALLAYPAPGRAVNLLTDNGKLVIVRKDIPAKDIVTRASFQ